MEPVYITGVGMTQFGTLPDSLVSMAHAAAVEAVRDSGAEGVKIDRLIVGTQNPDEFTGQGHASTLLADDLGLVPCGATRVESGPSSGSSAIEVAFALVASGLARSVLVIGVEKMSGVDRSVASRILAKMMSYENETRYGGTPASMAAMMARRYMHEYGLSRDDLSLIPVKAHRNGSKNPLAHFRSELTVDKVNTSRIVSYPLTVYDCCPTSDGAAAALVASKQFANEVGALDRAVQIVGIGHATDFHAVQHRDSLTSMAATVMASRDAFRMADLSPKDVDVCELHDAFSILELIDMEDIGFAPRGQAITVVREGMTEVSGSIPVNTTGGLKARGHPTGATGVAQIRDLVLQLRQEHLPGIQVDSPSVGLSHNIGGFGNNMVVTILRTP
ncbi:MAG: thiolase domain-containing protein [Candidatus Thorarchaeota archaeon]